jgi:hypothetical protein
MDQSQIMQFFMGGGANAAGLQLPPNLFQSLPANK